MTDVNPEKNIVPEKPAATATTVATATPASSSSSSSDPVAAVTDKLAAVTIHTDEKPAKKEPSPQESYEQAKKAYVEARFNPTDENEKKTLAAKLAIRKTAVKKPASEEEAKKHDEVIKAAQETDKKHLEEKRAILTKEFEADFELKFKEDEIVEAYTEEHFKPTLKWSLQTQAGYEKQVAQERVAFAKANRAMILHEALRAAIRTDLGNETEVEKLDEEERVQAMMEKPKNDTYNAAFGKKDARKIPPKLKNILIQLIDDEGNKSQASLHLSLNPVHFSLKAKQLWSKKHLNDNKKKLEYTNPQSNPINFVYADVAKKPFANSQQEEMMITAYKDTLASATSFIQREEALKIRTQKPFTRLGLKPKA